MSLAGKAYRNAQVFAVAAALVVALLPFIVLANVMLILVAAYVVLLIPVAMVVMTIAYPISLLYYWWKSR